MQQIHEGLIFGDNGTFYRITFQTEANTKEASDAQWASLQDKLAKEPTDRDWFVNGIGYCTYLFFVKLGNMFDSTNDAKIEALRCKARELLS